MENTVKNDALIQKNVFENKTKLSNQSNFLLQENMGSDFESDGYGSNFEEVVDEFVPMCFVHLLLSLGGVGEEHGGWSI